MIQPIPIRLARFEYTFSAQVGLCRQISSRLRGSKDAHGLGPEADGYGIHIEGACAECAAGKATGRYWPASVDTYGEGDDVTGFQVRRRSLDHHDLLIRPQDAAEKVYVHVTGCAPEFKVWGWMYGHEAKIPPYFGTHAASRPPAWFVPSCDLHPLDTLPPA